MRAPGAERSTDWRSVAAEAAGFARRVGMVPVLVLLGAIGAVVAAGFLAGVRHGAPEPVDLPLAAAGAPPPIATTQPSMLRVHLAGAVAKPGLYEVPASFRVGDLVDAAGGPTADADTAAVNLAERMRDGQQVYVPLVGEQPAASIAGPDASGPLDVNTATAAQLEGLPGIGPSLAAAIVAYRAEHGPFATLDALEQVPGIGPSKLSQLRPRATV
ncbi:helix-hairpin-helix domain-containing protein [Candidatus Poriferisodalis sp.]|uniref:helix-hairpin-helix domain-containing protein n=1 Tax=Candidatus Poriferisodalis sp. TaxID=3101277 RepID=UPI003B5B9553